MLDSGVKRVFIGVAWPYVNGDLHIGHYGGYLLPADISARYHRLRGKDVLMVSGSDCFGTPITIQADKEGTTPEKIVEEYHAKDVDLFKLLGLSYDLYTKTDTENHRKTAQEFFLKLLEKGFIFRDFSDQYYSESEGRFLPDRYVEGTCPNCKYEGARGDQCDNCGAVFAAGELVNPLSRNTKTPVELKKTEHYFLDWPKLQPFLEEFVGKASGWRSWVLEETKDWLDRGLKPRAITRDIDWGIKLPADKIPEKDRIENIESKRLYVWFDAVIGYYSASVEWASSTGGAWEPFWYDKDTYHYYFMGKDNLIFHTLFWPGQLHGFDPALHLPDFPAINQYLNLNGKKFSKSRGNIVDTREIVEKFGNDPVRFYLCLISPENADTNFTWDDFYQKVDNVLIGNFGNYLNRVFTLAEGLDFSNQEVREDVAKRVLDAFEDVYECLDSCKFKEYLEAVLELSAYGNALLTKEAPWKSEKDKRETLFDFVYIAVALSLAFLPLLPKASKEALEIEGVKCEEFPNLEKLTPKLAGISQTVKIRSPKPLFGKITPH